MILGYIVSLGLVARLVLAGGAYERYDPYAYITSTSRGANNTIVSIDPPQTTVNETCYVASAFYANYHNKNFTIDQLQWTKLNSVTYGYIPMPSTSFANFTLTLRDAEAISKLVIKANEMNVTTLISFGGPDGSAGFSSVLASRNSTTQFIRGIKRLLNETGVDGIEFDWEYSQCSPETPYTSEELSTSFLQLLKGLRAEIPEDILITAAVGPIPFVTPSTIPASNATTNGTVVDLPSNSTLPSVNVTTPLTNVSTTITGTFNNVTEFAKVLDYFTLLAFDFSGPWSKSGVVQPGAPLSGICNLSNASLPLSVPSSVASWLLSGVRGDQIVLGVSALGRSYRVPRGSALHANGTLVTSPKFSLEASNSSSVLGDPWWIESANKTVSTPTCNVTSELSTTSGVFSFQGLIDAGFLDAKGEARSADGIVAAYDQCSQAAFVYKDSTQVLVAYENAKSMAAKGGFLFDAELLGFTLYEAAADSSAILLDAIRSGAGLELEESCIPDEEEEEDLADPDDDDDADERSIDLDEEDYDIVYVDWADVIKTARFRTKKRRALEPLH